MPLSIKTKRINNMHTSGSSSEAMSTDFKKIIIGICAMQRKSESKPMRSIMNKMVEYYKEYLDFVIFPEEIILNESVEKWPLCDCLISFHSTDFPLKKAIEYEKFRRPYVLNDLQRQFDLLDRRKVFRTLARAGIDHPRHCMLLRNEKGELIGDELHEFADHIEVNGMIFNKPFVEKPVNAEDHNIYIYFPSSVGGGSQRLFRKVNDRSSWYSPVSTVRPTGSYIYEEFIPADGTDVKVYAVGPYYAHAEARKAPGLDGKVERDADGKEVRYPVILSAKEKTIARRVVLAFGQSVCGFDLLRANGRSYVCDVNGFSFVKSSTKYYEDTAKILGNTILRRLATSLSIPWHIPYQDDDPPLVSTPSGKIMELRCVLAVIRHGDRTPKQKMKVAVTDERFFRMFQKYDGVRKREIKMKKPNQLMEVLEIARQLLCENQEKRQLLMDNIVQMTHNCGEKDIAEMERHKELERDLEKCEDSIKTWEQMRTVLEMYGHFSGINRKVQLKYFKPKALLAERLSVRNSGDESNGNSSSGTENNNNKNNQRFALEINDLNNGCDNNNVPTLLLILKWGGELTTAGVLQAEALGKLFRTLYPGIRRTDGKDSPEDTQGLGFLRLHSTYRHDLKIYASDEGRVQMTAAAFAKGLLALEGELTPILMQMVKSANTDGLLNDDYNARQFQDDIKRYLHSALQVDRDFTTADFHALNPSGIRSLNNALEFIRNPRKMCHEIAGYMQRMCDIIRWHKLNNTDRTLYLNESWELAERRWGKELREFSKPSKSGDDHVDFDISKIPDIYDNIKYDMEHNPDLCINNEGEFERFYMCVKNMADIVVPQEYGINEESKISIAQRVCTPLLAKIRNDLHRCTQNTSCENDESLTRLDPRASEGIATPMRHVRTRLYFTSESHIHTLVNLIRYGGLCSPDDKKWQRAMNFLSGLTEFNYMTQLVMMVYEDSRSEDELLKTNNSTENNNGNDKQQAKKNHKNRFHIELLFSPGLYPCFQTEKERIYESRYSNRHKTSTDSKNSTATTKGKNNSGGAGPIGNHSSTGTSNGESHGDREMSETGFDQSGKSFGTEQSNVASALTLSTLSFDMDSGAQSDYSQASEAPTRKTSTAVQPSPKELNREDFVATSSIAEQQDEHHAKQNSRDHKESTGSCRENDGETDEDDLTEENAVNLVVLDEVSAASHGKGFSKRELARHSPPSAINAPIRKRHATYERNPEKTPEHGQEEKQLDTVKEGNEFQDKKQQQFLGGNQDDRHRKTSIEELMRAFFNKQANRIGEDEATTKKIASNKQERAGKRTKDHQSKPIIKSMSDASMSDSSKQKLSLDEADELEEEEKNDMQHLNDGINDLDLEENQATVGHDRGQWVKQLADNNRKDSNAQQIKDVDKLKDVTITTAYTAIFSSSSSSTNNRVPLAKIFLTDESNQEQTAVTTAVEKPDGTSKVKERRPIDNCCNNSESIGITFDVCGSIAGHNEENAIEGVDQDDAATGNGGLKLAKIDNKPSASTIKDEEFTEEQSRTFVRRPRFPYRFKHHTVNLLTAGTENKLISTDVLMGKFNDKSKRKASSNSVVLATAVIGRSSSAPRLQTYSAGDELRVTEIRRFWPPLRSLETMHDNLSFKEIDQFLERMMKSSTPLPSPPKTPTQYESLTDINKMVSNNNSICTLSPLEH